ncbi:tripartite tricarboxylate transporter substrate binding protein [Ramlibacter rhizophilus]|uniref:Tripartite tricarboxylate transporter substrate binding protein n=1 Tax=Ramlibacter rhizophilus TaxID=1781167 RepID=A0A4Z0BSP4_9BURK|nr:tripartite tricarboxylate transporter substrate binding protein [Ramlibacter rhizophilus]TFZ01278.1 tripartite tricarboxylate transporter substrate binding protein [Ramlibacter rhizophilus]
MSDAIRLIVPYVQGGGSDQRARLVARHLATVLGEPVEVVNRTGAIVGHTAIAQAAPDGRTLGQISGEVGMMHWTPGLTTLTPADYTPLAVPFVEAAAVIVRQDAPWATLAEFVEHCRTHGIRGSGGPHFGVWKFALAGLLDRLGVDLARLDWVETYSGEQGLAKVLDGHAEVAPITLTDARGPLQAGQARALANLDTRRHARFADVPTAREALAVDWAVGHWRGIVAPAGLPPEITRHYVQALQQVAADSAFQEAARASSFTLDWRFGDDFARYMDEDDAMFGRVIRALGPRAGSASSLH